MREGALDSLEVSLPLTEEDGERVIDLLPVIDSLSLSLLEGEEEEVID